MQSLNWYKTLTLQQRTNLKGEGCQLICGAPFPFLIFMLGFRDTVELIYNKLIKEGFFL